jgi:hypothetical protein
MKVAETACWGLASTSEDTWFAYGAELLKITFDYHSTAYLLKYQS